MREWLGNKNFKLQLLFRGTRDSFSKNVFHQKLSGQGATLHLAKSEQNRVFGGYRSVSYPDNKGYNDDPNAFIFSITNKKKLNQIKNTSKAISSGADDLTQFSYGADIHIYENSN